MDDDRRAPGTNPRWFVLAGFFLAGISIRIVHLPHGFAGLLIHGDEESPLARSEIEDTEAAMNDWG
jgi:hypothetical protein